jgi:predicted ribosomally synthesized peptide with SipW-like signal peptide
VKRSILLSGLIIGAVLSIVAGAGTFATFTDSATGTQTLNSGTVDVLVDGTASDNFTINMTGPGCPSDMAFGDSCSWTATVENDGSLSFTTAYTIVEVESTDPHDCWTVTYTGLPAGDAEGGDADADHDPGDSHSTTLTATLDNPGGGDDNICQGATDDITLTIDATQSPSPHD